MDAKYLQEIKPREQAATPGEWKICDVPGDITFVYSNADGEPDVCYRCSYPDAAFIAHARADIPALVAELEQLTAELNDAHKDHIDDFMRLKVEIATLKKALDVAGQYVAAHAGNLATETWPEHFIKIAKAQEQEEKH